MMQKTGFSQSLARCRCVPKKHVRMRGFPALYRIYAWERRCGFGGCGHGRAAMGWQPVPYAWKNSLPFRARWERNRLQSFSQSDATLLGPREVPSTEREHACEIRKPNDESVGLCMVLLFLLAAGAFWAWSMTELLN